MSLAEKKNADERQTILVALEKRENVNERNVLHKFAGKGWSGKASNYKILFGVS